MLRQLEASLNNLSLQCVDGDCVMSAFPLMAIVMMLKRHVRISMKMKLRMFRLRTMTMPPKTILSMATLISIVAAIIMDLALVMLIIQTMTKRPVPCIFRPGFSDHGSLSGDRVS